MSTTTFRTAAIIGNGADERVGEPMRNLVAYLRSAGIETLIADDNPLPLDATAMPLAALARRADVMIAIGGDGTLLGAAAHAVQRDVPLLGINRGRLGFLTDVKPSSMEQSIGAVLSGDYSVSRRSLLRAELTADGSRRALGHALNDIVVARHDPGRMIDFVTYVDGRFVNEHSGDGLIAATPTGSTAYALSCSGPILHPDLDAVALVPICPHTLSDRPIVVPGNAAIRIELTAGSGIDGEIICDGQALGTLTRDASLHVATAERHLTLLHPPGHDYFELLRSKLNWGRSERRARVKR